MLIFINPKSEYRNPKQYLNTKFQIQKQKYYNVFTYSYIYFSKINLVCYEFKNV